MSKDEGKVDIVSICNDCVRPCKSTGAPMTACCNFSLREERDREMTDIYIVVKCGHEGIESLLRGFTDPDDAVELINKERARYDNPSKDDVEFSYYFHLLKNGVNKETADKHLEAEKRAHCIQRDSGDGFECVCEELGVALHDGFWLY